MPIIVSESILSRSFQIGQQVGWELVYDVFGSHDDLAIRDAVKLASPAVYDVLQRTDIQVEPVGPMNVGTWRAHVRYTIVDADDEFTFDTTGGTIHIKQSLATVSSYSRAGETPPDHHGAINVTEDKVEGVEIPSRKFEWSESHSFEDAEVSGAFKRDVFALTGTVNDAAFKGFAAGECLFMGALGAKRGDEKWRLTFKFAGEPNATDLEVGAREGYYGSADIDGIDKDGWDYLWVQYAVFEDAAAKALVRRPVAAYVERVFKRSNFTLLGIGV
jgi:hypothetical protein